MQPATRTVPSSGIKRRSLYAWRFGGGSSTASRESLLATACNGWDWGDGVIGDGIDDVCDNCDGHQWWWGGGRGGVRQTQLLGCFLEKVFSAPPLFDGVHMSPLSHPPHSKRAPCMCVRTHPMDMSQQAVHKSHATRSAPSRLVACCRA